jgi:hypothetical protein
MVRTFTVLQWLLVCGGMVLVTAAALAVPDTAYADTGAGGGGPDQPFNCATSCLNSNCYEQRFCVPVKSCNQNNMCLTTCCCYNKQIPPNYECVCAPNAACQ